MDQAISRSYVSKTGDIGRYCLIQDSFPLRLNSDNATLTESKTGKGSKILTLRGRFQLAGEPNANGRIYEASVLRHAVSEIQEDIKGGGVWGELDHPPDAKIHLPNVSHRLTKLWMEGKEVFGEVQAIPGTPMGNILTALVKSGGTVGISSRGVGEMENTFVGDSEFMKVMPGYTFVTFDVVAEPSVSGSFLNVMESKQRLLGSKVSRKSVEKNILKELKRSLNDL